VSEDEHVSFRLDRGLVARLESLAVERDVSRSELTIDDVYGHLVRDSEQAFRDRLAARSGRSGDVVATDGNPGVDG
jgi:hypothetical protein